MAGCPIRRARRAAAREAGESGSVVTFPYLPRVVGADKPPDWDQSSPAWRLTTGTPQEAVISPLLANLYLHRHSALSGGRSAPSGGRAGLPREGGGQSEKHDRPQGGENLARIINDLNPLLRG
jgi:hypothetical protein